MLQIPFYKNRGHNCAECNLKSILGYYFPHEKFKIKDIRNSLKREIGNDPHLVQLVDALSGFDLELDYASGYGLDRLLRMNKEEKLKNFKKHFGNGAENIINSTNFDAFAYSLEKMVQMGKWRNAHLDFSYVEESVLNGDIALCLLNWDLFCEMENKFKGHYVIITDINENSVWYNDVGPCNAGPNKEVCKEHFISAWNKMCFFDENTLFIRKK